VRGMSLNEVYADFVKILGYENVLRGDYVQPYSVDKYTRSVVKPTFILKPASVQQLLQILSLARKYGMSITPRGGGFDLAMGSMVSDGIIIDLTRLNEILEVNDENYTITVQCGVTFEDINEKLTLKRLSVDLEPITSPEATIGGFIASHGIGYGLLRHGCSVLNIIRDLEVVLSDGTIIHTGFKNLPFGKAGYNLTSLMIGSEGLFGIITEVTLSVFPAPETVASVALNFSSIEDGLNFLGDITKRLTTAHSAFMMNATFKDNIIRNALKYPFGEFSGLIRLEGSREEVEWEKDSVENLCGTSKNNIDEDLWNYRFLYHVIRELNYPVLIDDYIIPVKKSAEAYNVIREIAAREKLNFMTHFLYLGSNIVLNLMYVDDIRKAYSLEKEIDEAINLIGGRPLTIGLRRVEVMKKTSPCLFNLLSEIKRVLDGINLFCPNKLL